MAAALPSPKASSAVREAPVSLFLDTDLGTRLAMLVAPDTTVRLLKLQAAAEHAAAFPDIGPVAVKSFQVCRKGGLYHLSDTMTVTSAFTRVKGGCFLHVKMAEAATRCCRDDPEIDGMRSSDGNLGINVNMHVRELPLPGMTSEVASDVLPQRLEGVDAVPNDDLLPSSSQLNNEMKEAVGLLTDAEPGSDPVIDKAESHSHQIKHANQTEDACISSPSKENANNSSNQDNVSHVVDEVHAKKEDIFHDKGDHDAGGSFTDNKRVRIQATVLEEIHAVDDLSQVKEHKKARRTGSFENSSADPIRITNESDVRDITKPSGALLETNTTAHGDHLNTQQEVHVTLHEESIQLENPITVIKKKKRKKCKLPLSGAVSVQETIVPSAGPAALSKSTGDDTYNVVLTGRDENVFDTSELNDGNQGAKHVQFVSNAHAYTDHAHKGSMNLSTGDTINSTVEAKATEGKTTKGGIAPWNVGDRHGQVKQHNEGSHGEGLAETSNMEKDDKSIDSLGKRQTNDSIHEKKHKKAKKVSSVDIASMGTTDGKEMHEYRENAAKSDTVCTEKVIVHDPSMGQISNNVHLEDSNVIENPSGDKKKKKKKRHHSESKDVDPSHDLTKLSGLVTNESLVQHIDAVPLDAKQTTQSSIGATVSDHKMHGESDIVAMNVIDEVLADLSSKDCLNKDLDGDILTGETHLGNESTEDKLGVSAELHPKYPVVIHSDAPASSPKHKKSKGKELKVLSTITESSHHSSAEPVEDGSTASRESLRFPEKTSDPKDILIGNVVAQADDKTKATKRQRKKVSLKQVPTDDGKTSDEQVNQVATLDLKGVNATQGNLVQEGSVISTLLSTVGKVQQKGKRPSKTRTPKIQATNNSIHGQDSQVTMDEAGIIVKHDNENAAGAPTESPVVQKDASTHKSASPNTLKERKKSSNNELHSWDSDRSRTEKDEASPKNSADAVKPNYHIHPASDEINFLDHFNTSKMNDPVSAENKQNNVDEILREVKNKTNKKKQGTVNIDPNNVLESVLPTDKTSLTGHFGTSEAVAPPVTEGNMNRENENVKNIKEKKRRKRKANVEVPAAEGNPNCDNQVIDTGTQDSLLSVVQKGRMGQENGKEGNNEVSQNDIITSHGLEDARCDRTVEKKINRNDVDGQNILPTDKDHVHISKEGGKTSSQTILHAKSRNHDEPSKTKNPKAVNNLVKSFSTSPPASSDSTEGTPQNANQYRVAVRKVPSKRYEQTNEKSKRESSKVGSGAISNGAIIEGYDDEMDTKSKKSTVKVPPDNSSTFDDSAYDESEVSDDDGIASLSQRNLRNGLAIGSILRGSCSYKKAKKKQIELMDDDTEVPDSQPVDGLWD